MTRFSTIILTAAMAAITGGALQAQDQKYVICGPDQELPVSVESKVDGGPQTRAPLPQVCECFRTPENFAASAGEPAARDLLVKPVCQPNVGPAQGLAAQASSFAIGDAVFDALNGGGGTISRNQLAFSTKGIGSRNEVEGWVALQARRFDGDVDGRTTELTIGLDFELAPSFRLGALISHGSADLDVAGTQVEARALSFGPYFKAEISDTYDISGYLVFARPEYDIAGVNYTAERRSAGIAANARYLVGTTELHSYVGVTGFKSDHPASAFAGAHEVSAYTAAIGTRVNFNQGASWQPYVSFAYEFTRFDDGLGIDESHSAPRVGAGVSYETATGSFDLDVNAGEIIEGTRDIELGLKYQRRF